MSEELNDIEVAKQYETLSQELGSVDISTAFEFWRATSLIVKNTPKLELTSEVQPYYQRAFLNASRAVLPLLPIKDLEGLFGNSISGLVGRDGYQVNELMRQRFAAMENLDERDEEKTNLKQIVLRSKEPLTQEVSVGAAKIDGSVSAWINRYLEAMGQLKQDSLKMTEFLHNDQAVRQTTPEEQKKIEGLIRLFVQLSRLSDELDALEDEFVAEDADTITVYGEEGIRIIDKKTDPDYAGRIPEAMQKIEMLNFKLAQEPSQLEQDAEHARDSITPEQAKTIVQSVLAGKSAGPDSQVQEVAALMVLSKNIAPEKLIGDLEFITVQETPAGKIADFLHEYLAEWLELPEGHAAKIAKHCISLRTDEEQKMLRDVVYYDMELHEFVWNKKYISVISEKTA